MERNKEETREASQENKSVPKVTELISGRTGVRAQAA